MRPALVWGDSRIGNILFDETGKVQAVLDWEMVSIGDPIADLAWFLLLDRHHSDACDVPRLPGFPSREETIARWEAKTGYDAGDLEWWELLGAVRYAAILTRVLDLLDDSGAMPGCARVHVAREHLHEAAAAVPGRRQGLAGALAARRPPDPPDRRSPSGSRRTSDRNFYDRYYFNCHAGNGELMLVAGMGQYPNLGVADAFAVVNDGSVHRVVRASRELGSDRGDVSVGPFRIEVIRRACGRCGSSWSRTSTAWSST